MQNQSKISTNKIVILLVFLCASVMASLFVFHLRSQSLRTTLSNDAGTIFPVARDIKPFDLVSTDEKTFSQKNLLNHWTLLFFGFTHCSNVCPATLHLLNRVYAPLQKNYPQLQVVLVSLDPERDSTAALKQYTQSFNPAFIGVSGKLQELRKLQSQLGVFSARDENAGNANYQLQHTASIFLINPQGKWVAIYKFGLTPQQLTQAFNESITSLPM